MGSGGGLMEKAEGQRQVGTAGAQRPKQGAQRVRERSVGEKALEGGGARAGSSHILG